MRAGACLCVSVIISVYLKESVPGLLCYMGHVRKWGVYHDPLTPIHLTADASLAPGPASTLAIATRREKAVALSPVTCPLSVVSSSSPLPQTFRQHC